MCSRRSLHVGLWDCNVFTSMASTISLRYLGIEGVSRRIVPVQGAPAVYGITSHVQDYKPHAVRGIGCIVMRHLGVGGSMCPCSKSEILSLSSAAGSGKHACISNWRQVSLRIVLARVCRSNLLQPPNACMQTGIAAVTIVIHTVAPCQGHGRARYREEGAHQATYGGATKSGTVRPVAPGHHASATTARVPL